MAKKQTAPKGWKPSKQITAELRMSPGAFQQMLMSKNFPKVSPKKVGLKKFYSPQDVTKIQAYRKTMRPRTTNKKTPKSSRKTPKASMVKFPLMIQKSKLELLQKVYDSEGELHGKLTAFIDDIHKKLQAKFTELKNSV